MEKLSVIIPCYNVENYIEEGLNSIINQTYNDLEILCLNDCSTDNTLNILKKYGNIDKRIKVYSNDKNEGLIFTLNKLVELANCPILVRMDPDDISESDRIEILYKKFTGYNADIISSDYSLIDENSIFIKKKGFTLLETELGIKYTAIFNSPFPHPQSMMKKDILIKNKYNHQYKAAEDYKLWTDLLLIEGFKGKILNKQLYRYRINPYGMSLSNNSLQIENHIKIAKLYLTNILGLNCEKIEFWKIAKKSYNYNDDFKELDKQLSFITDIKNLFIRKFVPNKIETFEIKNYTFQYLIFCYKNILEASIEKKISKKYAFQVILKSIFKNFNLISISNLKWLIKNI